MPPSHEERVARRPGLPGRRTSPVGDPERAAQAAEERTHAAVVDDLHAELRPRPRRCSGRRARIWLESRPMHIGGEVALLPAGSESEWLWPGPPTMYDSLPVTTLAPPVSVQPAAPSRSRRRARPRSCSGRPTGQEGLRGRGGAGQAERRRLCGGGGRGRHRGGRREGGQADEDAGGGTESHGCSLNRGWAGVAERGKRRAVAHSGRGIVSARPLFR